MTSRAEELAKMLERYNAGVMSQAICEDYLKAASELRRMAAEVEALRSAAVDVLIHVNGELPVRGWLNDNDKSRSALGKLKQVIKENPHG